jgi:PEP-CTERM motif
MSRTSRLCGFVLLFLMGGATGARAALIDFETASVSHCQVDQGGQIDGFTLGSYSDGYGPGSAGFNSAGSCFYVAPTAHSGQNYMLNYNSLVGDFTRDVGTFTLNSLWVHADSRTGPTTVRFLGLDGVGGNVLYTMDVDIAATWQQVNFQGWTDVKSFTWDSLIPGTSNIAIDDFEYDRLPSTSVPEPTTLLMMGSGLAAAYFRRRRHA